MAHSNKKKAEEPAEKHAPNDVPSDVQSYVNQGVLNQRSHDFTMANPAEYSDSASMQTGPAAPEVATSRRSTRTSGATSVRRHATPGLTSTLVEPTMISRQTRTASRERPMKDLNLDEDNVYDSSGGKTEPYSLRKRTKHASTIAKDDEKNEEKDTRVRKVPKLAASLSTGKAPKSGQHGPRGVVRPRVEAFMWYQDPNTGEWIPAAYHQDFRREFVEEDAKKGNFDNTPTSGLGEYDETSYVEPQEHWGESDEDLHKILDSQGREIMFMPERPADLRGIDRPGNWVYGGYLLLDQYNHPVRTWPNVNRALSSELEGFRLEALTRLYPGFTTQDARARMVHNIPDSEEWNPLYGFSCFTNRAMRFRARLVGILSWRERKGSKPLKEYKLKKLAAVTERANATKSLPRLSQAELTEAREPNKGKFNNNSRYVFQPKETSQALSTSSEKRESVKEGNSTFTSHCKQNEVRLPFDAEEPVSASPSSVGGGLENGPLPVPPSPHLLLNEGDQYAPRHEGEDQDVTLDAGEQSDDEDVIAVIPLFSSTDVEQLAGIQDSSFNFPHDVLIARAHGSTLTDDLDIYWYPQDTPRDTVNGVIQEHVVAWDHRGENVVVEQHLVDDFIAAFPRPAANKDSPAASNYYDPARSDLQALLSDDNEADDWWLGPALASHNSSEQDEPFSTSSDVP